MSARAADAGALASGLRVLSVTLAARGDLASARLCKNAATELTLKIAEDKLTLERAKREAAERELIEAAGECVRRWTRDARNGGRHAHVAPDQVPVAQDGGAANGACAVRAGAGGVKP